MFPIAGKSYSNIDFNHIDLSLHNPVLNQLDSQKELYDYIVNETQKSGKKIAYGGYGEERNFYLKSPLFSGDHRTLHLGIDIWLPIEHPVYAGQSGVVYGKAYNSSYLDYGYTIILKHLIEGEALFSLYGHLSSKGFNLINIGDSVSSGDTIAYIGEESQNGGWAPHLHFQLIKDLEGNQSDYPGVCHKSKKAKYLKNCPNPISWIIVD